MPARRKVELEPEGLVPGIYDVSVTLKSGNSTVLLNGFTVDAPVAEVSQGTTATTGMKIMMPTRTSRKWRFLSEESPEILSRTGLTPMTLRRRNIQFH